MAEEKESPKNKSGGSGNRKRSRRRYFKRKKNDANDSGGGESSKTQKKSGGEQQGRSKQSRNRRRRRRSKSRSGNGSNSEPVKALELDYTAPESVFIYTHVLRPEQRDSYSFRSEISAGTGRTLDDFDIDLSLLFPDEAKQIESGIADPEATIAGSADGLVWDEDDPQIEQSDSDETAQGSQFQSDEHKPSTFN